MSNIGPDLEEALLPGLRLEIGEQGSQVPRRDRLDQMQVDPHLPGQTAILGESLAEGRPTHMCTPGCCSFVTGLCSIGELQWRP